MMQRIALFGFGLMFCLTTAAAEPEITPSPKSEPLVQTGWEQALFPGLTFEKQTITVDDALRASVSAIYGVDPPVEPFDVYFAKDSTGKLAGGLLQMRIPYLNGRFTLAVGLNMESRIVKVMIPESDAVIHMDVHDLAPRGIVTRYTVASLPQVKQIAKSFQGRNGLGALVAQEVLRAGGTLKVLMDRVK
ncbi:MAG: hypothetical protein HY272_09800 [Gammaproteobacteria bacterium]|nr:hypothetical protein [Gammaproteobacteria bacterium]